MASTPATPEVQAPSQTAHALRVALAAVICLVLVEWWQLDFGYMAVFSTHMVMSKYDYSAFQKGVERFVGRALGILVGLVLVSVFHNAPVLAFLLKLLAMLLFFYVHFVGRLAYTFLNGGLYLAAIVEIGHADPEAVVPAAKSLLLAILIGIVVADLVTWLAGAEHDLHIQPGGGPLWPIRRDCVNHAVMLVVAVALTQLATRWLQLPTGQALISVMMLAITTDVHSLIQKGEMRFLGAFLAALWGFSSFWLLSRLPHFALLAVLLFFGMFLASYLTRTGKDYSYAGLQMGLVLPMVLVVPPAEFGTLTGASQRMEGIVSALVVSTVVGVLWPRFGTAPSAPTGRG